MKVSFQKLQSEMLSDGTLLNERIYPSNSVDPLPKVNKTETVLIKNISNQQLIILFTWIIPRSGIDVPQDSKTQQQQKEQDTKTKANIYIKKSVLKKNNKVKSAHDTFSTTRLNHVINICISKFEFTSKIKYLFSPILNRFLFS